MNKASKPDPDANTARGQHRLRRGRVSLPMHAYLVTTVCVNRRTVFACSDQAQAAMQVINDGKTWPHAKLLAWVLMPDHWHGLLMLLGQESLSRTMQRFKAQVRASLTRTRLWSGPVWQAGFHDHALRREEHVQGVIRYLVANPVRAGLVDLWTEWPYKGGELVEPLELAGV